MPQWYVVWAAYAARCIMQMLRDGKKTVEVTQAAYRRYNEALDREAANLIQLKVEGGVEKNYYVSNGRLLMNAPWLSPVCSPHVQRGGLDRPRIILIIAKPTRYRNIR